MSDDGQALEDVEHGTMTGYRWHKRNGDDPCTECKAADAAYVREWRRAHPVDTAKVNRHEAARRRALRRLAQEHPDEFAALLHEEEIIGWIATAVGS